MIQYQCRRCRGAMESPDGLVGTVETCPSCGESVQVPSQGKRNFRRKPVILLACVLVGAFLLSAVVVFLWPTPYIYRNQKIRGRDCLIRVNRITQDVRKLDDTGEWIPISDPALPTSKPYKPKKLLLVPSAELAKLTFQPANLWGGYSTRTFTYLKYRLYNGTDKPVVQVQMVLEVNGAVYKQHPHRVYPPVEPGSWCEGDFALSNPATVPDGATWSTSLTAVWWEEP